ncbi:MAG: rod shape-determining protein MreD [Ornithinimicrobium sp.]
MTPLPGLAVRTVMLVLAALAMSLAPGALPGPPDLVLIVVSGAALLRGPWVGAGMGLGGGWLLDVVPPGAEPLGATALVYAGVGALVGMSRQYVAASPVALPVAPLAAVALACLSVVTVRGVGAAAGFGDADLADLWWTWLTTLLVAVFLLPPVTAVERWLAVHRWA